MKRIKKISDLKRGDVIWSIATDGTPVFLEFLEIHPKCEAYSLMLDWNKDAPKFYNKRLETEDWYLYEGESKDSNTDIDVARIKCYDAIIEYLTKRIKKRHTNNEKENQV